MGPASPLLQLVLPPLDPGGADLGLPQPALLYGSYVPRVYISQYADYMQQHKQITACPTHEETAFVITALQGDCMLITE